MRIVRSAAEARALAADLRRPLGFVPTMGAIHAGHLALATRAAEECSSVAASIFVNPLQFGPNEDFERYPRAFEDDCRQLQAAGVQLLYAPTVETMYPAGFVTAVDPGPLASKFEGALRPGHFRGVATVVAKLLHAVEPDYLYMGQKDAQQTAVLSRMLADLDVPGRMVVVPTVRESDGLALSSRNAYLNAGERAAAPTLHRALRAVASAVAAGETGRAAVLAKAEALFAPPIRMAYLDAVDPRNFEALDPLRAPCIVIGSAWLGSTRIIDNLALPGADGVDPIVSPPANRRSV